MNHASVLQKITVFKEQNQQNVNFTQKHNSMNIYSKSMWRLLLPFRYKFRNAQLHLGKCHSHIIILQQSVPYLNFHIYHPRKGLERRKMVCWQNFGSQFFYDRQKGPTSLVWPLPNPWGSIEPRLRTTALKGQFTPKSEYFKFLCSQQHELF